MNITQWAKANNLTADEFKKEILTTAACVGMTMVELSKDDSDALIFTCEDADGEIELTVRRKSFKQV